MGDNNSNFPNSYNQYGNDGGNNLPTSQQGGYSTYDPSHSQYLTPAPIPQMTSIQAPEQHQNSGYSEQGILGNQESSLYNGHTQSQQQQAYVSSVDHGQQQPVPQLIDVSRIENASELVASQPIEQEYLFFHLPTPNFPTVHQPSNSPIPPFPPQNAQLGGSYHQGAVSNQNTLLVAGVHPQTQYVPQASTAPVQNFHGGGPNWNPHSQITNTSTQGLITLNPAGPGGNYSLDNSGLPSGVIAATQNNQNQTTQLRSLITYGGLQRDRSGQFYHRTTIVSSSRVGATRSEWDMRHISRCYSQLRPNVMWTWGKRDRFAYMPSGKLASPAFNDQELAEFIDCNPRALRILVGRYPANSKIRFENRGEKCRWLSCPSKQRTIQNGEYRVAFQEFFPEVASGIHDPYVVAGSMHLWCFEQIFDPVLYHENGLLLPDVFAYSQESIHPMSLDFSLRNFAEEVYLRWFTTDHGPHRRPHEHSLVCALAIEQIARSPPVRKKARAKRAAEKKAGSLNYHVGLAKGDLARYTLTKAGSIEAMNPYYIAWIAANNIPRPTFLREEENEDLKEGVSNTSNLQPPPSQVNANIGDGSSQPADPATAAQGLSQSMPPPSQVVYSGNLQYVTSSTLSSSPVQPSANQAGDDTLNDADREWVAMLEGGMGGYSAQNDIQTQSDHYEEIPGSNTGQFEDATVSYAPEAPVLPHLGAAQVVPLHLNSLEHSEVEETIETENRLKGSEQGVDESTDPGLGAFNPSGAYEQLMEGKYSQPSGVADTTDWGAEFDFDKEIRGFYNPQKMEENVGPNNDDQEGFVENPVPPPEHAGSGDADPDSALTDFIMGSSSHDDSGQNLQSWESQPEQGASADPIPQTGDASELPSEDDGWHFRFDLPTGRHYYFNHFTGVSQWANPWIQDPPNTIYPSEPPPIPPQLSVDPSLSQDPQEPHTASTQEAPRTKKHKRKRGTEESDSSSDVSDHDDRAGAPGPKKQKRNKETGKPESSSGISEHDNRSKAPARKSRAQPAAHGKRSRDSDNETEENDEDEPGDKPPAKKSRPK